MSQRQERTGKVEMRVAIGIPQRQVAAKQSHMDDLELVVTGKWQRHVIPSLTSTLQRRDWRRAGVLSNFLLTQVFTKKTPCRQHVFVQQSL